MKKNMDKLFDNAIVSKRNVLNEIRKNNMSLQELRFFSIYLSKINSYDISTRSVRFPLSDFRKIMDIGDDMNITHFRTAIRKLLQQIVEVPSESGYGYTAFQLFKECTLERDENNEWYVEIDAHDKALPLMFDFKNKYFSYELWNALRLKSPNQVRMYEILKQYENLGKREISVLELKDLLGITQNEYSDRWDNFKTKVLDRCQKALKENTDICYSYKRGKTGKGGKWLTIIFHIYKNKEYKNQLTLNEFIGMQPEPKPINFISIDEVRNQVVENDEVIDVEYGSELANLLGSAALNDEFSPDQVRMIQDLVMKAVPIHEHIEMCNYLVTQVHKMNVYGPKNRFVYLCKMIEKDIK